LEAQQALLETASRDDVAAETIIDEGRRIQPLDRKRNTLLQQLERVIADRRGWPLVDERPVRQMVLDALTEIELPQTASKMRDYIWALDRVPIETRSLAALRRDEQRSWQRNPDKRFAYITPALAPDGRPVPKWTTRSDWPLELRVIISPAHERLLDVKTMIAFINARRRARGESKQALEEALWTYSQHASDEARTAADHALLDRLGAGPHMESSRRWLLDLEAEVRAERNALQPKFETDIHETALRLARLPRDEQLWGRASPH
jgi:hypothetical protein